MTTASSPFSAYLFAKVPQIVANPGDHEDIAIVDQLLVSQTAASAVVNWLATPGNVSKYITGIKPKTLAAAGIKATLLTTVFANLYNPYNIEDIGIYALTLVNGGSPLTKNAPTVFDITQALRAASDQKLITWKLGGLQMYLQKDQVSPNHVLVPAPNEWCPYGPPWPDPGPSLAAPGGVAGAKVTVVDAGYIWDHSSWGTNPLDEMVDGGVLLPPVEADFLQRTSVNPPMAHWQAGIPNKPDTNTSGVLDAVAGHANFVAGVVAQHAFQPEVHIWDHSSAYSGDDIPTEASVCRSIYMSQHPSPTPSLTPVINCGFAETVFQDIPSDVWNKLFARFENNLKVDLNENLVFTAPAGNEGYVSMKEATRPHFPAALNLTIKNVVNPKKNFTVQFRVVGVASLNPSQPWTASGFSDYGGWVTASAIGEDVVSTFLHVNMQTEQGPAFGQKGMQDFTSNYAVWNGTSFAAPKVAGSVAARIAAAGPSGSAKNAWNALASVYGQGNPNNGLGVMFENL
jgi:hypothetical protein